MGFDGLCVNEHHNNAYGLMPSPNLMAAALTRRTSRAAMVVLGNSLAAYNPPLRVAEEFAMLDLLSGGRLVAGFPVGTSMDMNFAYGINPATLRERYYEAHDLVIQAWTRPEMFAFNGKYTQVRYVNIWPQPLQKPHPPVWIPGRRQRGDVGVDGPARLRLLLPLVLRLQARQGRPWTASGRRSPGWASTTTPIARGSCSSCAWPTPTPRPSACTASTCTTSIRSVCTSGRASRRRPGYRTLKTMQAGMRPQVGAEARKIRQSLDWPKYLDPGYVIAGSPATVRQQLTECIRACASGT